MHYLFLFLACCMVWSANAQTDTAPRLGDLTWPEAEAVLDSSTVVVIPMGAGSKEHGPHLPLACDQMQAEWVTEHIAATERVVIAPVVNYGYYFYFTEFPGSTSVRFTVQRDMLVDICRGLSAFGPRRFYVINIGISTVPPLKAAAAQLAREGILLHYTDLHAPRMVALEKELCDQKEGTHADEVETSLMLHMHPTRVSMGKALKDYGVRKGAGIMVRTSDEQGMFAPSGIYGDATLATFAKGDRLSNNLVELVRSDIDSLRRSSPASLAPATGLEEFTGTFVISDTIAYHVTVENNALHFTYPSGLKAPMYDEGDGHFAGSFTDLRFLRNDARAVTGVEAILVRGERIRLQRRD